jgi:hypothetical protein
MHLVVYMGIWREISLDSTIGQSIEHVLEEKIRNIEHFKFSIL